MNKAEVEKLLGMMQVHYPFSYKDFGEDMMNIAINSWHNFLSELDVRLVFNIVGKLISTTERTYPPTIAEILKEYHKAINPVAFISPENAWESVRNAIKKFGYYRESEALASLSASAMSAVKTLGWRNLCLADDKQFDFMRKNFIEAYKNVEQDERQSLVHPQAAKRMQEIADNIKLPEIYQKLLEKNNGNMSEM